VRACHDLTARHSGCDRSAWDWTLMIAQPAWIISSIVGKAREKTWKRASKEPIPALERMRFAPQARPQLRAETIFSLDPAPARV